jgi:hypothetical protein
MTTMENAKRVFPGKVKKKKSGKSMLRPAPAMDTAQPIISKS